MYDTMTPKNYSLAQMQSEANTVEARPLTREIMERTSNSLAMAQDIRARLFAVRDSLFGTPPSIGNERAPAPSPCGFADAFRDKFGDLESTLSAIDMLSSEIASRL